MRSSEGIASNILAERLVKLVSRRACSPVQWPEASERYSLTEAGIATLPVIVALDAWALDWRPSNCAIDGRQRVIRTRGLGFFEELMDELRVRHLEAPPKRASGPGPFARLDWAGPFSSTQ